MSSIKVLIFDLDGTIGNTLPHCIKAFRHAIEPLINRSLTDAEIIATFGPSEEGTIMALAPNHYDKGITDYLSYYKTFHAICPNPFPGIRDLLDSLKSKGLGLAMVTGKGKHSTAITLKEFGLEHYFEMIETGWAAGPRKPAGIQNVIQHFAPIDKKEMIYIGDSPSDIMDCKQVGIPVVAAAWAETADIEKLIVLQPDEIFLNVSEFVDWLHSKIQLTP